MRVVPGLVLKTRPLKITLKIYTKTQATLQGNRNWDITFSTTVTDNAAVYTLQGTPMSVVFSYCWVKQTSQKSTFGKELFFLRKINLNFFLNFYQMDFIKSAF